jgi:hypothetical protein
MKLAGNLLIKHSRALLSGDLELSGANPEKGFEEE